VKEFGRERERKREAEKGKKETGTKGHSERARE